MGDTFDQETLRTWVCTWSSHIDTEHLVNIHCFNLWDIKLSPLLSVNFGALIESEIWIQSGLRPKLVVFESHTIWHWECTLSGIWEEWGQRLWGWDSPNRVDDGKQHRSEWCSGTNDVSVSAWRWRGSDNDIDCVDLNGDGEYIDGLESEWKEHQCGRPDHLPKKWQISDPDDDDKKMNIQNGSECRVLWAAMSQIYGMCSDSHLTLKWHHHLMLDRWHLTLNRFRRPCARLQSLLMLNK